MKTEVLNYYLLPDLIAQRPVRNRSSSRLLVLDRSTGWLTDSRFSRIGEFLRPGDCLVLNDTKVLPARFFAQKAGATAKLEGLFLAETTPGLWDVMLKGARKLKPGDQLYLKDKHKQARHIYPPDVRRTSGGQDFCNAVLLEKNDEGICRLKIDAQIDCQTILSRIGFPPLPPYIKRDDDLFVAAMDARRYQTVYARKTGAVAAPTAGLHFTNKLIEQLKQAGINFAHITLHVGMGTFKPITAETLEDHRMHQERFEIDSENARIINQVKNNGGRIIAVGTTSVRTLETIAAGSKVKATGSATGLFIRPGYKFKIVDAMITNFHLPKSTLLALAAAFAGLDNILTAYKYAIEQRYRFYSYGDAMLIM
jgi:S-adenosylmethionine:tRNA ribosyltransferase-isomerase